MPDIPCKLDHCFLCRHCMPEWKDVTALHRKTLNFRKGKSLFGQGEPVKGIFFIYSGAVKIHAPWGDGREMIIRWAKAGDIAGLRGLGGNAVFPISATALEDTTACFIPNEFLELSLKANPSLTYTLMHFYATELQAAEKRMRDLTHMEVKGRIAGALLDIAAIFGTNPEGFLGVTLTRQDIAAYAGTTYETAFKFFTELTAAEVISTSGKDIRINQPERLTRLAGR
ncbi:MAG TPA: Crp/Fnr family transcriptional regulator [Puia sp.]|nr:Crp/Fnr family transcriptional regulator [Puia sp.]